MKIHILLIVLLSIVSLLATICTQHFLMANFCLNFWWNMGSLKCNSLAIIRTVSRRSDRTRACTFSTLLPVFEFEILPERGSHLLIHGPLRILLPLEHLLFRQSMPPYVCFSFLEVSIPVSTSLTWKLIANLFSKFRSSISVTHTKNCFTENLIKNSVDTSDLKFLLEVYETFNYPSHNTRAHGVVRWCDMEAVFLFYLQTTYAVPHFKMLHSIIILL